MALINNQHNLHLLVDVEQPLHKEGVGDLELLSLVVLETWAVVECHFLDHYLCGDRSLRVLIVPDLNPGLLHRVQDGLQPVKTHNQLRTRHEGHDGALADTGIADHDDRLVVLLVEGDGLHALVDECLQLNQVDGSALLV